MRESAVASVIRELQAENRRLRAAAPQLEGLIATMESRAKTLRGIGGLEARAEACVYDPPIVPTPTDNDHFTCVAIGLFVVSSYECKDTHAFRAQLSQDGKALAQFASSREKRDAWVEGATMTLEGVANTWRKR